ncbi:CARDB domain-containing protein [Nonomuraea jabiensis]|uniref:Putative repeat protein (TIGR01451 family) n=1 Tax=Nonomuraea jabiensis TaxID=882448 RepID=A0A7W9GCF4_9ACTN|nr:CARDB domain-containing protein [Nonomuraea jabiensis]MBB5781148.1 putative repeat protein (TIGR01451 family) [Nonomuraea jabiensis]
MSFTPGARTWRRRLAFGAIGALLAASIPALTTPAAAAAAPNIGLTFSIDYLRQLENPDDGFLGDGGDGDYYPKVRIADGPLEEGPRIEDDEFSPKGLPEAPNGWVFTKSDLPGDKPTVNITVSLWDWDNGLRTNDDRMDISPQPQDVELDLVYDLRSGSLSGDGIVFGTPCIDTSGEFRGKTCVEGNGDSGFPEDNDGRKARIGITVTTDLPDTDKDGIPDIIELSGIRDRSGAVLADLPALGADPCRKTIILQVDYMADARHTHQPKAAAIALVRDAFKNAPVRAASPCPYGARPDGVDFVYIPGARLTEQPAIGLVNDTEFVSARNDHLPHELSLYAHYAIFAHDLIVTGTNGSKASPGTSGECCEPQRDNNKDFLVTLGSWRTTCVADFGVDYGGDGVLQTKPAGDDKTVGTAIKVGDDGTCDTTSAHRTDLQVLDTTTGKADAEVGTVQDQAGTLMHELGHALGLAHGGDTGDDNFKPNYLSVMNYFFQSGIPNSPPPLLVNDIGVWKTGATRIGYSTGKLPPLFETSLMESNGIGDGTDYTFWTTDNLAHPGSSVRPWRAGIGNGPLNWNDNTTPGTGAPIIDSTSVSVDINGSGGKSILPLTDHNDWAAIRFRAGDSPDSKGKACSNYPVTAPTCTGAGGAPENELDFPMVLRQEISFFNQYDPDLATTKSVDKRDAEPGDTLTYQVKLDNVGTGAATAIGLTDTPPGGPAQTRQVPYLGAGASTNEAFTYPIPCDTANGTVLANTATATAKDAGGGAEANTANNTARAETTVHAPKLTLAKTAPRTVNAGEAMTIDLKVANAGSGTATGVTLTDTLPAEVAYSRALDQGTGPKPSSVTANPDGTTTLTWSLGSIDGGATSGVRFTARPSLLFAAGNELPDAASVAYRNGNGCVYEPVTATASTTVTEVPPTRDPWPQLFWQLHPDRQSAELLARIQATDARFDGADGSAPDGALTRAEVNAVFALSISEPDLLRAQLLTTYLNLADRRINAATKISSLVAAALELKSVAQAARHAQATLLLPDDLAHLLTYTKATTVLTEINLNLSERY